MKIPQEVLDEMYDEVVALISEKKAVSLIEDEIMSNEVFLQKEYGKDEEMSVLLCKRQWGALSDYKKQVRERSIIQNNALIKGMKEELFSKFSYKADDICMGFSNWTFHSTELTEWVSIEIKRFWMQVDEVLGKEGVKTFNYTPLENEIQHFINTTFSKSHMSKCSPINIDNYLSGYFSKTV